MQKAILLSLLSLVLISYVQGQRRPQNVQQSSDQVSNEEIVTAIQDIQQQEDQGNVEEVENQEVDSQEMPAEEDFEMFRMEILQEENEMILYELRKVYEQLKEIEDESGQAQEQVANVTENYFSNVYKCLNQNETMTQGQEMEEEGSQENQSEDFQKFLGILRDDLLYSIQNLDQEQDNTGSGRPTSLIEIITQGQNTEEGDEDGQDDLDDQQDQDEQDQDSQQQDQSASAQSDSSAVISGTGSVSASSGASTSAGSGAGVGNPFFNQDYYQWNPFNGVPTTGQETDAGDEQGECKEGCERQCPTCECQKVTTLSFLPFVGNRCTNRQELVCDDDGNFCQCIQKLYTFCF